MSGTMIGASAGAVASGTGEPGGTAKNSKGKTCTSEGEPVGGTCGDGVVPFTGPGDEGVAVAGGLVRGGAVTSGAAPVAGGAEPVTGGVESVTGGAAVVGGAEVVVGGSCGGAVPGGMTGGFWRSGRCVGLCSSGSAEPTGNRWTTRKAESTGWAEKVLTAEPEAAALVAIITGLRTTAIATDPMKERVTT